MNRFFIRSDSRISRPTAENTSHRALREIYSVTDEHTQLLPSPTDATPGTQETEAREYWQDCYAGFERCFKNLSSCLRGATTQDTPASATQGAPEDPTSAEPSRIPRMSVSQSDSEHPSSREVQGKETAHPGEPSLGGSSLLDTRRPMKASSPIEASTEIEPRKQYPDLASQASERLEDDVLHPSYETPSKYHLKCDMSNKIDEFIEHYATQMRKSDSLDNPDNELNDANYYSNYHENKLWIFTSGDGTLKCKSMVDKIECAICVSDIYLEKKDTKSRSGDIRKRDIIRGSDMIALHFLFGMQQLYGIGESNGKPITPLVKKSILALGKSETDALNASLSPLFSPLSSNIESSVHKIPEQFRKINKLMFERVSNDSTRAVVGPIYARELRFLPKGTDEYNDVLEKTELGRIAARMHQKYFSNSSISQIELSKGDTGYLNSADITVHFAYEA